MEYIVHRRFKDKAICGSVNLPVTTVCQTIGNMITYKNKPICIKTSQNACDHFAINDDGNGLLRGKLTRAIQKKLNKHDSKYDERWLTIWNDECCRKYKRDDYIDYWLWDINFFEAPIEDLLYIAKLIDIKEERL